MSLDDDVDTSANSISFTLVADNFVIESVRDNVVIT